MKIGEVEFLGPGNEEGEQAGTVISTLEGLRAPLGALKIVEMSHLRAATVAEILPQWQWSAISESCETSDLEIFKHYQPLSITIINHYQSPL